MLQIHRRKLKSWRKRKSPIEIFYVVLWTSELTKRELKYIKYSFVLIVLCVPSSKLQHIHIENTLLILLPSHKLKHAHTQTKPSNTQSYIPNIYYKIDFYRFFASATRAKERTNILTINNYVSLHTTSLYLVRCCCCCFASADRYYLLASFVASRCWWWWWCCRCLYCCCCCCYIPIILNVDYGDDRKNIHMKTHYSFLSHHSTQNLIPNHAMAQKHRTSLHSIPCFPSHPFHRTEPNQPSCAVSTSSFIIISKYLSLSLCIRIVYA